MNNNKSKTSAPPYVAYYGMVRDPFGEKIEDDLFYAEPSRKQRLGTLLHLTQFGNELMMVTGPKGSGKTTLLQQFIAASPKTWKIARIEGKDGVDERKILQQLYRQLGLEFKGATHADLFEKMKIHFELLQRKSQYCVMLINDADKLPVTALSKVLEIASLTSSVNKPLLRVILFGAEAITKIFTDPLLTRFDDMPQRHLELHPFNEEQVEHYILRRLSAANFASSKLFTPAVVHKLYTESYGWPARVNELASNVLTKSLPKNERESTSIFEFDTKTFQPSRLIGLVITIGLVAGFFVFQDDIYKLANQLTSEDNSNIIAEKPPTSVTKQAAIPAAKPATSLKVANSPVPKTRPPTSLVEQLKQRNVAYHPIAGTDKTAKPKASKQKVTAVALTTTAKPKAGKSSSLSVDIATLPRKESWILNQNSSHYTLQIVAGENLKTIEEFISEHRLHNNIAFYRSVRRGNPWYGLIYGVYTHKQAATSAISQLPTKLQSLKPWVRGINSIKNDIYKTRP